MELSASKMPCISEKQFMSRCVPHFSEWLGAGAADYTVVIPSYDRPKKICQSTLAFLHKQGISMNRVHVYINPAGCSHEDPQWYQYLNQFRAFNFLNVHLKVGGDCLLSQMKRILEDNVGKYIVVMSDLVADVSWKVRPSSQQPERLMSLPKGHLAAIIAHGHSLMEAGNFSAWSLGASHDFRFMKSHNITCRLGLLDGNLTGLKVQAEFLSWKFHSGDGLIYDVAWACHLWSHGHRFFRYAGLCAKHPYRASGGQSSLLGNGAVRRAKENDQIKRLALQFPDLVCFSPNKKYSLKRMQYRFLTHGGDPLKMHTYPRVVGRPAEKPSTPMSGAERVRKHRLLKQEKKVAARSSTRGRKRTL